MSNQLSDHRNKAGNFEYKAIIETVEEMKRQNKKHTKNEDCSPIGSRKRRKQEEDERLKRIQKGDDRFREQIVVVIVVVVVVSFSENKASEAHTFSLLLSSLIRNKLKKIFVFFGNERLGCFEGYK